MLSQRSAIVMDWSKQYLVVDRLTPLLSKNDFSSLDELVVHLRRTPSAPLWDQVIDSLTTNETSFFRDGLVFAALSEVILPGLLRDAHDQERKLHLWSAGCSSGQEAYSLAMLVQELAPGQVDNVKITACDISHRILERAKAGRYSELETSRGLDSRRRNRYFCEDQDGWLVCDEIKKMVRWQQFSLSHPWPPTPPLDLLLLRNVLVYFGEDNKRKVLERARDRLRDGGFILLGGAEASPLPREIFNVTPINEVTFYQKNV